MKITVISVEFIRIFVDPEKETHFSVIHFFVILFYLAKV